MKRKRVLSEEGRKLLTFAYEPPEYEPVRIGCMREWVRRLFTSDYDRQLKECVSMFRQGSEALVSSNSIPLPKACGNAMDNILLLILLDKSEPASLFTTKKNVRWFLDVAVQCMESKDDNAAIMLRAVLTHSCIQRLKLMNKTMVVKLGRLEQEYGDFINCQSTHIKSVLAQDMDSFGPGAQIPSFMTLDMYSKRNKEHRKAFVGIGKMPTSLLQLEKQLDSLMKTLREKFQTKEPLIPLYTEDPKISNTQLYDIVDHIAPQKTKKTKKKK